LELLRKGRETPVRFTSRMQSARVHVFPVLEITEEYLLI